MQGTLKGLDVPVLDDAIAISLNIVSFVQVRYQRDYPLLNAHFDFIASQSYQDYVYHPE